MDKFSIRQKIYFGFIFNCLMIIVAGIFGYFSIRQIAKLTILNNKTATKNVMVANIIDTSTNQIAMNTEEIKKATVPAQYKDIQDDLSLNSKKIKTAIQDYRQLELDSTRQQNLASYEEKLKAYSDKIESLIDRLVKDANSVDNFEVMIKQLDEHVPQLRLSAKKIIEYEYQTLNSGSQQIAESSSSIQNGVIIMILLMILVSVATGFLISQNLANNLIQIAEEIKKGSKGIEDSSQEIQNASYSLSSGASQQAASLAETVASMTQISSMVKNNTENAKTVVDLAGQNREQAHLGVDQINSLKKAMSEITDSSKKIEEIINVIDDIAFQTNLLALNAAVEAARAGEQGKGFAVVADAVRSLAQRSAVAAKDISTLIHDSVSRVEKGSQIVTTSSKILSEIQSSALKVTALNGDISEASQQQTTGIEQITQALNQLDSTSQSFASNYASVSTNVTELFGQAQVLGNLVQSLESVIQGKKSQQSHFNHAA